MQGSILQETCPYILYFIYNLLQHIIDKYNKRAALTDNRRCFRCIHHYHIHQIKCVQWWVQQTFQKLTISLVKFYLYQFISFKRNRSSKLKDIKYKVFVFFRTWHQFSFFWNWLQSHTTNKCQYLLVIFCPFDTWEQ